MYNGMIAPVVPYAIRGVLWYQGESITPPRELFPHINETLINDWRKLWGASCRFISASWRRSITAATARKCASGKPRR